MTRQHLNPSKQRGHAYFVPFMLKHYMLSCNMFAFNENINHIKNNVLDEARHVMIDPIKLHKFVIWD